MDEKIVNMFPDYARRLNATMREICSKPQGKDSTRRESLFYLVRKATLTADIANGQAAAKLDDAAETEITVHSDLDLKRNDDVWVIWRGRWDAAT